MTADASYGRKDAAALPGTVRRLRVVQEEPGAVRAGVLLGARHPARRPRYGRTAAAAGSAPCDQRTVAQAPLPRSVVHA